MSNPILRVIDAGRGTTPEVPDAKFERGDVVRWKRLEMIVAVAVPPGFAPEYALADLLGEARPLMVTRGSRTITYILVRENDPRPYLAKERDMRLAGKVRVEIGSIGRV